MKSKARGAFVRRGERQWSSLPPLTEGGFACARSPLCKRGVGGDFASARHGHARLLLALTLGLLCNAVSAAPPSYDKVKHDYVSTEGVLLDRNGEAIHELRVDRRGRRLDWVPLSEVSPAFLGALIRAEDKRFYEHRGVDWLACPTPPSTACSRPGRAAPAPCPCRSLRCSRARSSAARSTGPWARSGIRSRRRARWRRPGPSSRSSRPISTCRHSAASCRALAQRRVPCSASSRAGWTSVSRCCCPCCCADRTRRPRP